MSPMDVVSDDLKEDSTDPKEKTKPDNGSPGALSQNETPVKPVEPAAKTTVTTSRKPKQTAKEYSIALRSSKFAIRFMATKADLLLIVRDLGLWGWLSKLFSLMVPTLTNELITLPMSASPSPGLIIAVEQIIDITNISYAIILRPSTYLYVLGSIVDRILAPYLKDFSEEASLYVDRQVADTYMAAAAQHKVEEDVPNDIQPCYKKVGSEEKYTGTASRSATSPTRSPRIWSVAT